MGFGPFDIAGSDNQIKVPIQFKFSQQPVHGVGPVGGNGSFDVTEKKLELGGGVEVVTTDGMKLLLKDAYVDLKAGTMSTHRTINFTSSNASISAQSLEIFENGDRIVFETNVLLTFQPAGKKLDEK